MLPIFSSLLAMPGQLMVAHPVIGTWSPLIVLAVWVLWSLVMIAGTSCRSSPCAPTFHGFSVISSAFCSSLSSC